MSTQTRPTPVLPTWATELRERYVSGEASLFLIHGNVRDLQQWQAEGEDTEWISLRHFLERFLGRSRDVLAYYNVSQGLSFPDRAQEKIFKLAVNARRAIAGEPAYEELPESIAPVLEAVETLCTDETRRSGVILDYFEMIAPKSDVSFMTEEAKSNLVTLRRWSSDPALLATDNLIILVTEHLSDISSRVLASPQLVTLQIPFPEESTRTAYLQEAVGDIPSELDIAAMAQSTAGLTLIQLRSMLQLARGSGEPITFESISVRKKSIIERECHGLVEFVQPRHDLSHVGGMKEVKAELKRVADAVRNGHRNQVPMGMIFVGPMGTGKTFVAEAFAADSGLTCLRFKNFRDRWVGSTEANLEKVLELVDALGYVLLIIDEAERALAAGDNDGGTGSRVIARLKEFMSDTSHRGRVVMLMMTNRPDKLDTDLKRPGRFDLKIPFFPPETSEERELILEALTRKNKLTLAEGSDLGTVADATKGYSGAELESVLISAAGLAAGSESAEITPDQLEQATKDVIPSRDIRMLEYMELLAVFECSTRRMLPARYEGLDTNDVLDRLDNLKVSLGRRAR